MHEQFSATLQVDIPMTKLPVDHRLYRLIVRLGKGLTIIVRCFDPLQQLLLHVDAP